MRMQELLFTDALEQQGALVLVFFGSLSLTVHVVELDRTRLTLSVSGTTAADGKGALQVTPASFDASFERARVIYEVPFRYVQVHLPQGRNDLSIIATTHLDLSEPEAEGRLLFRGTCRLPKVKSK
jgi:hypothetical protein